MISVLDRTSLVAQVDQPERLADLKVRAAERFSDILAKMSPAFLKAKWDVGEKEHGLLTDLFSIEAEQEMAMEAADLFWYSAIEEAQENG